MLFSSNWGDTIWDKSAIIVLFDHVEIVVEIASASKPKDASCMNPLNGHSEEDERLMEGADKVPAGNEEEIDEIRYVER